MRPSGWCLHCVQFVKKVMVKELGDLGISMGEDSPSTVGKIRRVPLCSSKLLVLRGS